MFGRLRPLRTSVPTEKVPHLAPVAAFAHVIKHLCPDCTLRLGHCRSPCDASCARAAAADVLEQQGRRARAQHHHAPVAHARQNVVARAVGLALEHACQRTARHPLHARSVRFQAGELEPGCRQIHGSGGLRYDAARGHQMPRPATGERHMRRTLKPARRTGPKMTTRQGPADGF